MKTTSQSDLLRRHAEALLEKDRIIERQAKVVEAARESLYALSYPVHAVEKVVAWQRVAYALADLDSGKPD